MRFVDLSPHIKDGVILFVSSQPRLTQFLPPGSIFASQVPSNPTLPYMRYGTPVVSPYNASCWDGTRVRVTLDIFAQGDPDTEAGETIIGRLAGLLVEVMNDLKLEDGLVLVDNEFLGSRYSTVDQEVDRWRAMVEFQITAVQA